MNVLLSNAGRAFLKVFLAALLTVAIGVSSQPNLNGAIAVGIAGVMAALAAGLGALQSFLPQFTVAAYLAAPWGPIVDTFIRAALGAFITAIIGLLAEPSLSTWHAAIIGVIVGAISAGLRAVQGALTPGEKPSVDGGIHVPPDRAKAPLTQPAH
jgi:hypothetical protein